jgi:hypothetical protein
MTAAGYCAAPIKLLRSDRAGESSVLVRCKNRRAVVCPSCSDLYAGDTWHLVHAGLGGGHHIPATVAAHPAVFLTLTAPSYGPVHTTHTSSGKGSGSGSGSGSEGESGPCRPASGSGTCPHGVVRFCMVVHSETDSRLGQPICPQCYDYTGHALFTWNAPTLWARFTITLRRLVRRQLAVLGEEPGSVRVSFVKIVEMQRRGIPHFHAVIRLDAAPLPGENNEPHNPPTGLSADNLAALAQRAARLAHLEVPGTDGELTRIRFGTQIDTQPLTIPEEPRGTASGSGGRAAAVGMARRVAGYLAKYVTKSVTDFGIAPRRFPPEAIDSLSVSPHVALLLHALAALSRPGGDTDTGGNGPQRWLHTLGYRGHITTKSRRYSTTMGALRAIRAQFQKLHTRVPSQEQRAGGGQSAERPELPEWEYAAHGHRNLGERFLVVSAALRIRESRWAARQLIDTVEAESP